MGVIEPLGHVWHPCVWTRWVVLTKPKAAQRAGAFSSTWDSQDLSDIPVMSVAQAAPPDALQSCRHLISQSSDRMLLEKVNETGVLNNCTEVWDLYDFVVA